MGELSHLDELEAEAIYIIREVAAECEKPVMLYSIGKDSSVMLHLAMKAFYPEKPPFPFLHVNTTWKFKEMIQFRDETAKKLGIEMLEYINEDGVKKGINPFDHGSAYTDIMKTQALKQALNKYGFTAAFGGGRRDEEKSRAKERIFSFRNENHAWDPKNQRPEMWKLYNAKINKGESIRVFPISNWTETDIWQYIKREKIDIVPLYFAAVRPVVYREGEALLPYLEKVDVTEKKQEEGFYMPVQRVCRPDHTFRGFQGQIESGEVKVGDEIVTLPSNERAHIKSILVGDKDSQSAFMGQPVTLQLDKEVDVSRGCVIASGNNLPISKSFTATILWMDDEELTPGTDYLVKLGTKQIPGILKNIQYKIDVNTGEFIPAGQLKKNEIAVCDLDLQEPVVIDEFKKHKTLGELILIDRISNMTSACGVVEDAAVDESKDLKAAFVYGSLKGNGDIFEEFYYNLESMTIAKVRPVQKTYTIGDEIPVSGESYQYPDDFDIVILRERIFVQVRGRKVEKIAPLAEYQYSNVPVINGRGFAVAITSAQDAQAFLDELAAAGEKPSSDFFNKWLHFETYRKIIFKDEIWL